MSRVLVVAADESARDAFSEALVAGGFEVGAVAVGLEQGIEALRAPAHDQVLSSFRFGEQTVVEILASVVEEWTDRPPPALVVVTDDDGEATKALIAGAQRLLGTAELAGASLRRALEEAAVLARRPDASRRAIDQLRRENAELRGLARNDALTGLLNRRGFEAALERESERSRRTNTPNATVLVDLDDFKRVNDTFGHQIGDQVLRAAGEAMLSAVRPTDYVSRLGGDEYLVLLCEVRPDEAAAIAERLRQAVASATVRAQASVVSVTCSIGWALLEDVVSLDVVVEHTSDALKRAKALGKDMVTELGTSPPAVGSEPPGSWTEAIQHLRRVVERLRSGVDIHVVAQPVYQLSSSDPELIGYELLARGPRGLFQMPESFFKLAVENQLGTEVDLACLTESVRVWRQSGLGDEHPVHLNVMPQSLIARGAGLVLDAIEPLLDGPGCVVELSERRVIGSPTPLLAALEALRARGVSVVLDSVGLSRSALEAILVLAPSELKCEVRLVRCCDRDAGKRRTLSRLAVVARRAGIPLVAVGVETAAELAVVRDLGVDRVQGNLLAAAADLPIVEP